MRSKLANQESTPNYVREKYVSNSSALHCVCGAPPTARRRRLLFIPELQWQSRGQTAYLTPGDATDDADDGSAPGNQNLKPVTAPVNPPPTLTWPVLSEEKPPGDHSEGPGSATRAGAPVAVGAPGNQNLKPVTAPGNQNLKHSGHTPKGLPDPEVEPQTVSFIDSEKCQL